MTQENTNNKAKYNVFQVANCFIKMYKEKNNPITHMKLQKLIYFANGLSLALFKTPLIQEKFQAWRYGPVVPELYNELKCFGDKQIESCICNNGVDIDKDTMYIIANVDRIFGNMNAWELSELTHIKEGAWDKAPGINQELRDEDVAQEFNTFHIPALSKK